MSRWLLLFIFATSALFAEDEPSKLKKITQSVRNFCDPLFLKKKACDKLLPSSPPLIVVAEENPTPPPPPKIPEKRTLMCQMPQAAPLTPAPLVETPQPTYVAPCLPPPCDPWAFPFIPAVEWRIGSGRSYQQGYQTLRAFLAAYQLGSNCYPFLDVRAHRVAPGRFAANVGAGIRSFSSCFDEMVGINFYYDYRRVQNVGFQQVGLGGEIFVKCWDFRVNGYIPFGTKRALHDTTLFNFSGGFASKRNRFVGPMWGLDVEVGHPLFSCGCIDFYTAIGPYFYRRHSGAGILGGMWRFAAESNWIGASIYVTNDNYFDTKVQAEVAIFLPLPCCFDCIRSLFMPVWRNDIIVTEKFCTFKNNF